VRHVAGLVFVTPFFFFGPAKQAGHVAAWKATVSHFEKLAQSELELASGGRPGPQGLKTEAERSHPP
jgi:hypothetical protein